MREDNTTILDQADVPVLQVVLSGSARAAWTESGRGLSPSDLAMNVVLPELDGRLLTRAISFKEEAPADPCLEFASIRHAPDPGRVRSVGRPRGHWGGGYRARHRPNALACAGAVQLSRAAAAPVTPSVSTPPRALWRSFTCCGARDTTLVLGIGRSPILHPC